MHRNIAPLSSLRNVVNDRRPPDPGLFGLAAPPFFDLKTGFWETDGQTYTIYSGLGTKIDPRSHANTGLPFPAELIENIGRDGSDSGCRSGW